MVRNKETHFEAVTSLMFIPSMNPSLNREKSEIVTFIFFIQEQKEDEFYFLTAMQSSFGSVHTSISYAKFPKPDTE